jgi:disulfide oxidoreductase YuzD
VVYDIRLIYAPFIASARRPITATIRYFNVKYFNLNFNVAYIDLTDREAETTATGSVYNNKSY